MDEAVRQASAAGQAVSALTLLSLWPLPEAALQRAMQGKRRVVVAELNDGQLRREVERLKSRCWSRPAPSVHGGGCEVVGVHRLDGELITPDQILEEADL
jgi:2-oxoglutarate ferredoxin oxidoreductase subunit alpha